jgi:hypothetical protein
MTQSAETASIRKDIEKVLESIRTERDEQPLNMMSSGDVRAFDKKLQTLRERLGALVAQLPVADLPAIDPNAVIAADIASSSDSEETPSTPSVQP